MKIGITSTGKDLSATVDPRFGRCPYFIVIDLDSMEYECIENEYTMAPGGAGIRSAQKIIEKGVETLITGNIGPNAFQTLSTAGIKVITGATGKIKDVIEKYKKGELKEVNTHTTPRHFGKMNEI
ncbi:MAG: dinitrogenase iron-molybdenum cofactor biosynthesis protein [Thermoplasmata archaeon]|nr:MAG: dinitrogenase iron-molybdenum cofactor biosynthesis protein [Thermoplasmata archaeon]